MSSEYLIRFGSLEDLDQLNAFDPFGGDRRAEIEQQRMFVAEARDQVLAYISWLPGGFVGRDYISFLCVERDHRREGLALRLLDTVEKHIGRGRLFISTEEDNALMLAILTRHGWTHAGAVQCANEGDRAEVFFYKDLSEQGSIPV